MAAYMFCFGYETPTQHDNNSAHGWDDSDSSAVFIECDTADEALDWGCEIAERFVARLWAARGEPAPSWKSAGFAYWIESDAERIEAGRRAALNTVRPGEFPD